MSDPGSLRRLPRQERSIRRVERMLDACAELVESVGYDDTTTTLIASRAGVPVGSLYQFFPDKRAVAQALARRNVEQFLARLAARLAAESAETGFPHVWDAVDTVIDEYVTMRRTVPGFRMLDFGARLDAQPLDETKTTTAVIAGGLVDLAVERFGLDRTDDLALMMSVAVEAAGAALSLAFRRDPGGDPALLGEAAELIRRYLAARIPDRPR